MVVAASAFGCRPISRQSCQHCKHHDGNGQHGLCHPGVPGCCQGSPGHGPAGHLWGPPAPSPPGLLPCSLSWLCLCQVCHTPATVTQLLHSCLLLPMASTACLLFDTNHSMDCNYHCEGSQTGGAELYQHRRLPARCITY